MATDKIKYMDGQIDIGTLPLNRKRSHIWFKIIISTVLYSIAVIIQVRNYGQESTLNGIIAQVQVMVSVFLSVQANRSGYFTAVIINCIAALIVLLKALVSNNYYIVPGIVIPLCTIITITIIYSFSKNLKQKFLEAVQQKEEIVILYEELTATQEELNEQNIQLLEYNHKMKENEEKLNYIAYFDSLTELPNRKMIISKLDQLISCASVSKLRFAVVFIDLDNFKRINDSLGHHVGDLLLKAVVSRLIKLIHPEDLLGRLGGDEFALIIQRNIRDDEIFSYVESLRKILLDDFSIERNELTITASFGVSIYPDNGNDSAELIKSADTAMYKAKDYGKNAVQFFCNGMKEEILRKIEFEHKLLASIHKGEVYLVFQPQYSSEAKKLRGFEALVRWNSSELGFVSPVKFIPVAEETRFIITLGEWILRTACKKTKKIYSWNNNNLTISVNISTVQIMDPHFVDMVKAVLDETGFDGKYLEFEITESVFISSLDYVVDVLKSLKEMGIRIALDDFGTGYSSLNYIQQLPIDTLKIDKTFIDNISTQDTKKQIVGSIINLVHQMEIAVVAEGVESELQLNYLEEHNCDLIQGYIWGRPMSEHEMTQLVRQLPAQ